MLGLLFSKRNQQVTQQELARQADMPARELEHRLLPYLQAGYPIELHPHGTICLREPPDVWCAEEILGRLGTAGSSPVPAWNPLLLTETGSTNDVARDRGRKGEAGGFVVAASRQTAGRGRLGRAWESLPGRGLYVSILLRPDLAVTETSRLPILAGVAGADAVEAVTGQRPQMKWPNDLLIRGRKLGGLLVETEMSGSRLNFAIIGIGINVRHAEGDFSTEVRPLATSLYLANGQLYRRADVLVALLQALEARLARPFGEAREAWSASSLTLGQRVELTTGRGRKLGQAMGLDDSGALLLRGDSGEVEAISAGDMQALRP
jgi:BirA family biotin operon repressor/biotin-[acetyl-CoA-carboxylase] ligase